VVGGGGSSSTSPAIGVRTVDAPWTQALDAVVSGPRVSVAVGVDDTIVYTHAGATGRTPASGQKLLTSIAALEAFGPSHRFATVAAAQHRIRGGVLRGDLWLIGEGDPELGALRIGTLAQRLVDAGLRRIGGSVVGDTSAFSRRWWAPGWVAGISRHYVRRPTALTFDGNMASTPELAAAAALSDALRARDVIVGGSARTGAAPRRAREIARVGSAPLRELLVRQNHSSLNLHAEVLLRALGADAGTPTTAGGADVVERLAAEAGYGVRVRDGSGLSHGDDVSAVELASMLLLVASEPWGPALEASLPRPGDGTLRGRLTGLPVRAKTGTLFTVPCSALAGYVRDVDGTRIAFAVLSDGIAKGSSIAIEDAVVRVLSTSQVG
jgi:D-alanyl-D-alanine carboxypeptidase/D-alanyl-D-alanine-endopeptidase (penicillin-binding protein 4)